jgi:hypothetical protein
LTFRTVEATRGEYSPDLPEGETDPENSGVRVLAIDIPAGTHTIAVIFSPVWDDSREPAVPPPVDLKDWTLISHLTV